MFKKIPLQHKKEHWNQDIMRETVFARAARHGPGPFYTQSVIERT
jgi:hypothetical protein